MKHIFISYKRNDPITHNFIELLQVQLKSKNFDYWNDRNIVPGENWEAAIDNAIRDAYAVILLITRASVNSQYITYEWSSAFAKKIKVIPLVLEQEVDIHPRLDKTQYIDFSDTSDRTHKWQQLFDELTSIRTEFLSTTRINSAHLVTENRISSALIELYSNHKVSVVKPVEILRKLRDLGYISEMSFAKLTDLIFENSRNQNQADSDFTA